MTESKPNKAIPERGDVEKASEETKQPKKMDTIDLLSPSPRITYNFNTETPTKLDLARTPSVNLQTTPIIRRNTNYALKHAFTICPFSATPRLPMSWKRPARLIQILCPEAHARNQSVCAYADKKHLSLIDKDWQ